MQRVKVISAYCSRSHPTDCPSGVTPIAAPFANGTRNHSPQTTTAKSINQSIKTFSGTFQDKSGRWGWIGYTLRKDPNNAARNNLGYNQLDKRKPRRPKGKWRRSMLDELTKTGTSWQEAKSIAWRGAR